MTDKSKVVRARVSTIAKARFEAVAAGHGLSPSDFLRLMIDQVTEGVEIADDEAVQSEPKREAKVTVRLSEDVAGFLADDAKAQGVTASTWAASILMAKFREAPQPVKPQRKAIRRSFRQLQGMATNTNQMATLMNRGVFTGDSYAPSRNDLMKLRQGIAELRGDLSRFAGGQYEIQRVRGPDDE